MGHGGESPRAPTAGAAEGERASAARHRHRRRSLRAGTASVGRTACALDRVVAVGRSAGVGAAAPRQPGGFLRPSGGRRARRPRPGGRLSMRTLGYVAVNVFRESVRDKVLYNLVVFAVGLMAASYLIGQLTAGQDIKIIKDLGL